MVDYDAYIHSPWWVARTAAVIRYRSSVCERCGRVDNLELRHRTLERLGHELPEDVELLCPGCRGQRTTRTEPGPTRIGPDDFRAALH